MRKKAIVIALVLVMAVAGLLSGCGGQSQQTQSKQEPAVGKPITLKYAFFAPAGTFPAKQMDKWAEEVEKRTGGKVKVEKYPGGSLLTAQNMYDGVLNGVADIGLSCPSYEPGRFPLLGVSDLPGLYPNARVASLVLYDLVKEFQPKELSDFKVVTVFHTEPGYIQSKKPVRKVEDVSGLRLRTTGTGVAMLKALGGAPVSMPMSDIPQSLQTGVIDGYISSREVLKDMKYAEYVKYVTVYPTFEVSFAALMNKKVWDSLPPDVQKVIDDLSREMALWAGTYVDSHVKEGLEWAIKQHGLQVITLLPEEKAKFDAKLKGLEEAYIKEAKGIPGQKLLERIKDLSANYSKEYK